jgi:drug/metabolite transporter superfamily protein YnfA
MRARLCRLRRGFCGIGHALGWDIDRKPPDLYDAIGAGLCLVGIAIIMWNPRP